ncbi:MAG TPA: DUF881 domain-containing protein [Nocardioidaceae bacterium]|nr:DUF881 domain-containing protein [Nocardioidaceae bacterium]
MAADQPRGGTTGGGRSAARSVPPPQAVMGLLNYITAHSLDEDYAHVSEQRTEGGRPVRPGSAALVVMLLFGLLVTIAGIRTAHNAPVSQTNHAELVTQIKARSAKVDARRRQITAVQADIRTLQAQYSQATAAGQSLATQLSRLGRVVGTVPVHGPGVRIVVDDAPNAPSARYRVQATDLQVLVNALWLSGAEAIAINGRAKSFGSEPERLTARSAIREAGSAITVNYRSLSAPYVITAIGNPNQLPARFVDTRGGSTWFDLQAAFGLRFHMTSEESLTLPAAHRLSLHFATTPEKLR